VVVTQTDATLDPVERARIAAADPGSGFGNFFLSRFLNLDISYDDEAQTCQVVLPYAPYLCNPQGTVHGGIITTAMDISMGHLCHRFLATAVTIEMQLRFFRPLVGTGRIEGRLLRPGRRLVHLESRLFDEQDKLAAFAVGSWHRMDSVQPTP
jgi:acyl-CoA thioesterase